MHTKDLEVLYEDNHVIVVNKPAGILVQHDKTGQQSLMDVVKEYLKEKYHKPGNVFLGLVHRLDRPTSGVIVFARTSKAASRLSEQMRKRQITKKYRALIEGTIKANTNTNTLSNVLTKDGKTNTVHVHDARTQIAGGKVAILHYKILKQFKTVSLVEITLETGRSHQIRAQFSHIGHPVVGDAKYGAKSTLTETNLNDQKIAAIALHAYELTFKLPAKEGMRTIQASTPKSWNELTT